jgi:hypothetical protein
MFLLFFFLLASPLTIWLLFVVAATVAVHVLPFVLVGVAIWVIVRLVRGKSRT